MFLDKALLRGSKFVEMDLRIMDEWNQIPRHSKFPIGSCVATTFGVGILVGWRVEDDIHIIRSLWKRSGPGSGVAFLRRDCIHGVVEAAVGFDVQTTYGAGRVLAYTRGGCNNLNGKYFVKLNGRLQNQVVEFHRCQILSCQGATFVPVTEHIRAAALYRLEILQYKAKLRETMLNSPTACVRNKGMWRNFSEYVDLFATSFSKAIAEDPDFDAEFDKFFSHIINLLDGKKDGDDDSQTVNSNNIVDTTIPSEPDTAESWNINDILACFFVDSKKSETPSSVNEETVLHAQAFDEAHESAMIFIRVLTRTVTVARASVPDRPRLHGAPPRGRRPGGDIKRNTTIPARKDSAASGGHDGVHVAAGPRPGDTSPASPYRRRNSHHASPDQALPVRPGHGRSRGRSVRLWTQPVQQRRPWRRPRRPRAPHGHDGPRPTQPGRHAEAPRPHDRARHHRAVARRCPEGPARHPDGHHARQAHGHDGRQRRADGPGAGPGQG